MRKKIFLILQFLLFSVILSADNAQTYNNFEKFNVRMSTATSPFTTVVNASKDKPAYFAQLNAGSYLAFIPTRLAIINYYEFFSDVLKKDFKVYETNKKGKIKYSSDVIRYDENDFYSNYKKNVKIDRVEIKNNLNIVEADTKLMSPNTYKITNYATDRGFLVVIPMNMAFYVKQINDNKFIWSLTNDFKKIEYTFTLENNKLIVRNNKNQITFTIYKKDNSLFLEEPKNIWEYRVNTDLSQFEYYKNSKLTSTEKYQITN